MGGSRTAVPCGRHRGQLRGPSRFPRSGQATVQTARDSATFVRRARGRCQEDLGSGLSVWLSTRRPASLFPWDFSIIFCPLIPLLFSVDWHMFLHLRSQPSAASAPSDRHLRAQSSSEHAAHAQGLPSAGGIRPCSGGGGAPKQVLASPESHTHRTPLSAGASGAHACLLPHC